MKDPPRKASVRFRRGDEWLLEAIDEIVEIKRLAGFKSSFSFELIRLAKKGLMDSAEGAEMDKVALIARKLKRDASRKTTDSDVR